MTDVSAGTAETVIQGGGLPSIPVRKRTKAEDRNEDALSVPQGAPKEVPEAFEGNHSRKNGTTLDDKIKALLEQNKALRADNAELSDALDESEAELEAMEQKVNVLKSSPSKDLEYVDQILSSIGVPSNIEDMQMSLADRVVYLTNQSQLITTTLQNMRSEMLSLAHDLNNSNPELSERLFALLRSSNKMGAIVFVENHE